MDTPLRAYHGERGAVFEGRDGAVRLTGYGPFDEAYGALEDGCALFDLSETARIELRGEDRVRFLNGMVSNDVQALVPGGGCRACMLNRQSRILADLFVLATPGALVLLAEPALGPAVAERIDKYRLGLGVEMTLNPSPDALFSLQGPAAPDIVKAAFGADVSELAPCGHVEADKGAVGARVVRLPRTGRPGYDLIVPAENAEEAWRACLAHGAVPAGWDVLETGRVEAGLPRYGADLGEKVLFSEADVPDAVSYRKGCYVGQEIVARVRTYGQLKKRRRGLLVEGRAGAGDPVEDQGKDVAELTSARFSPMLQKTAAFAYLRTDLEDGRELTVRSADGPARAVVAPYPFV